MISHTKFKNISKKDAKKLIETAIIEATEYASMLTDRKENTEQN